MSPKQAKTMAKRQAILRLDGSKTVDQAREARFVAAQLLQAIKVGYNDRLRKGRQGQTSIERTTHLIASSRTTMLINGSFFVDFHGKVRLMSSSLWMTLRRP